MSAPGSGVFDGMAVDHVLFYVEDVAAKAAWYVDNFGFSVYAATAADGSAEVDSLALGGSSIRFVLTEARIDDHPAAAYVAEHGDGVAGIAMRVTDAAAAFTEAVRRGARPADPPATRDGVTTASIMGFGDVVHTFVERRDGVDERVLPGLLLADRRPVLAGPDLGAVDHFAVCVEPGHLAGTVAFYRDVLDFDLTFAEHLTIGKQAMTTQAVQSRSGSVTLTLIEPDASRVAGHIDEFLKSHGGAGVQHIAFTAADIVTAVRTISERGVEFLGAPDTYYSLLPGRVELTRHPVEQLRAHDILVDGDHDGLLYQIFARSVHPRNTFFLELVERMGASSFGSGNITALYQAVELQRARESGAPEQPDRRPG